MEQGKQRTKNVVLAGLCLSISVVMPTVFHFAGPQGGKMFLPLFWGVALAAVVLDFGYALSVAMIAPLLSNIISGMPAVPMLYFMLVELIIYAAVLNFIKRKIYLPIAVLLSLIISRAGYIVTVSLAGLIFELPAGFVGLGVLLSGVAVSLPGIAAQTVIIPLIYKIYGRVWKDEG